jgi:hypothetical protein
LKAGVLCGRRHFFVDSQAVAKGQTTTPQQGTRTTSLAFSLQYQRLRLVWNKALLAAAFRLLRVTAKLAILAFGRPLAKIAPTPI